MSYAIRALNSWLCFIIGTALNVLLLLLVHYHTGAELRAYSRILVQSAVVDLIALAYNPLFQPVFNIAGNYSIRYATGLLVRDATGSIENREWNFRLFTLYMFLIPFTTLSLSMQFYYRYTTLCRVRVELISAFRSKQMSLKTYLLLLLVFPGGIAAACAVDQYLGCSLTDCFSDEKIALAKGIVPAEQVPHVFAIFIRRSPKFERSRLFLLFIIVISFVPVVWYSLLIRRYMARTLSLLPANSEVRRINVQLNVVLLVQACTPLVLHCFPGLYGLLCGLFGNKIAGVAFAPLYTMIFNWLPVLNALIVLLVVKSYREELAKTVVRIFSNAATGEEVREMRFISTTVKLSSPV